MLRFKKSDGSDYPEWEICNLEEISSIYDGTHQTPNYVSYGVPFVSVENIDDIKGTDKYISNEAFDEFKVKPQINDIFMTRITAGIIGATYVVADNEPLGYYVSLALIRPKKNVEAYYLSYFINCRFFKKELHKRIIHTAFPKKINKEDIGKCVVKVPCIEEQKKISTLFSSVDEVISAIESEVALWEEKKKGVMQKIFSQEVRFKKEDDLDFPEWRNYQFSEIAELSKEKYNPKSGDIYKCIELDNIEQGTGVINGCVDSSIQNSIKNVFHVGDVLFGKLRPYLKKYARPNFAGVCSSEIWVLRPKKEMVSTDYLYCLIASDAFIAVSNISSGTKMPRADWKLVACSTFDIPSLNEQQKIANCIVSIEKVIGIKKKKLEIWKTIKKGLVQQMFV